MEILEKIGKPGSLFFSGGYMKLQSRSSLQRLFVSLRLHVAISTLEYPY